MIDARHVRRGSPWVRHGFEVSVVCARVGMEHPPGVPRVDALLPPASRADRGAPSRCTGGPPIKGAEIGSGAGLSRNGFVMGGRRGAAGGAWPVCSCRRGPTSGDAPRAQHSGRILTTQCESSTGSFSLGAPAAAPVSEPQSQPSAHSHSPGATGPALGPVPALGPQPQP